MWQWFCGLSHPLPVQTTPPRSYSTGDGFTAYASEADGLMADVDDWPSLSTVTPALQAHSLDLLKPAPEVSAVIRRRRCLPPTPQTCPTPEPADDLCFYHSHFRSVACHCHSPCSWAPDGERGGHSFIDIRLSPSHHH